MASVNQGGSILSFVLIGGVLAVLLVGGVYAVQQRSSDGATPAPATPVVQSDKTATSAKDADKVAVEQNKDKDTTKSNEAAKPEATKPTTAAPIAPPQTAELPKTGPAENFIAVIGLGLLTAMSISYIQSRKRTATL